VHAQIEAVMGALRVTQARVEGSVRDRRQSRSGSCIGLCCRAVVATGRAGTGRGGSRGSDPRLLGLTVGWLLDAHLGSDPVRSRIVKAGGLGQPCEQLEFQYIPSGADHPAVRLPTHAQKCAGA
jgi:hypothetical protein